MMMKARLNGILTALLVWLATSSAEAGSAGLRSDPKLQARLSIVQVDPDLSKVFHTFKEATGFDFALDDQIGNHRPNLGGLSFRNTPVWVIMGFIATVDLEEGRWEKTADGYRLTAKSIKTTKSAVGKGNSPHVKKNTPTDLHLRRDARLQAKVSVGTRPTLESVLRDLEQATGLKFGLGDGLENHAPDFGKVHLRNVPAWMVMALVTENQMQDGRWEKTETGYQLVGKSLALPQPTTNPWLVGLWWIGAGVVAVGVLWAIRRRLGKKEKVLAAAAK